MEDELSSHESQLKTVVGSGQELVDQAHFGADKISSRIEQIMDMWNHLSELSAYRKKRLLDAIELHQVRFPPAITPVSLNLGNVD